MTTSFMRNQLILKGVAVYENIQEQLYAVGLMLCGSVPTFLEQDATALVFIGMIAVPLFFAKENWIY